MLTQRASFVASCAESLQNIASRLQGYLGQPVDFKSRVVGAAADASRLRGRCAYALFELTDAQTFACLEIELPFLCAVLDAFAGGGAKSHVATQLTRVEEAAFGFLALEIVAALRGDETIRCRLGPGLSAITLDRDVAAQHLGAMPLLLVDVDLAVGELQGRTRLLIPSRPLEAALMELPAERPALTRDCTASIEVSVRLGTTSLDAGTVGALGRGDVVVLDGVVRQADALLGAARIEGPSFVLHGSLDADGFHHERAEARSSNQEQLPMPTTSSSADAATIPVDLEIELCRTRVMLADLAGLRAGSILGLRAAPTEPVLLKVSNRPIARAELVDIDGQLGARILEIFGDRP